MDGDVGDLSAGVVGDVGGPDVVEGFGDEHVCDAIGMYDDVDDIAGSHVHNDVDGDDVGVVGVDCCHVHSDVDSCRNDGGVGDLGVDHVENDDHFDGDNDKGVCGRVGGLGGDIADDDGDDCDDVDVAMVVLMAMVG